MYSEPMSDDRYQKQRQLVKEALKEISGKTDSKAAKAAVMEQTGERQLVCSVVHEIVDESLEMYENGEMELKDMVKDLTSALEAIDPADLKELSDEEDKLGEDGEDNDEETGE